MIRSLGNHYEKLLLVVVSISLTISLIFTVRSHGEEPRFHMATVGVKLSETRHRSLPPTEQAETPCIWIAPSPESPAIRSKLDLFTPPGLILDPATMTYVIRQEGFQASDATAALGEPRVIAVRQELYRLQLDGIIGDSQTARALLRNTENGEVVILAPGQPVKELQVTLTEVSEKKVLIRMEELGPVFGAVLQAELHDERANRRVILDNLGPCFTGKLLAVVQTSEEEHSRTLREGDEYVVGDKVYQLERVALQPAELRLTCLQSVLAKSAKHLSGTSPMVEATAIPAVVAPVQASESPPRETLGQSL